MNYNAILSGISQLDPTFTSDPTRPVCNYSFASIVGLSEIDYLKAAYALEKAVTSYYTNTTYQFWLMVTVMSLYVVIQYVLLLCCKLTCCNALLRASLSFMHRRTTPITCC
jgi:hypothetical protein